jgi:hypothetical protein
MFNRFAVFTTMLCASLSSAPNLQDFTVKYGAISSEKRTCGLGNQVIIAGRREHLHPFYNSSIYLCIGGIDAPRETVK